VQLKTKRLYTLDHLYRRKDTGVQYFGDQKKQHDFWYPHGKGQYKINGASRRPR
jgi:hypothetical protein